ncbi:uncharacterized protein LOC130614220 [Hydractinia symbiolongicarpus]|uniref:uncharacterized protein LOC130614220 n=1 Tax=Hydractinia symbiolongicarpus TaxID=13093 RepID=UPI00254E0ED4|nr:uncharacterized protein LOC130614220 [Hydractinia symbiolongicarpus]
MEIEGNKFSLQLFERQKGMCKWKFGFIKFVLSYSLTLLYPDKKGKNAWERGCPLFRCVQGYNAKLASHKCVDKTKTKMAALRIGLRQIIVCTRSFTKVPTRSIFISNLHKEKVTHTGQKYDEGDWKQVRFIDKKKVVNPNFAIDLIDEIPPMEVSERVVSCDGGGGALGHPKVFINLDKPGDHACGYCGLRFVKKAHH